ncbi:MAG: hypothetical protein QJR08_04265 [Bacillota bacterium]|nr:hypothetical protein [Bacillota bacterium]
MYYIQMGSHAAEPLHDYYGPFEDRATARRWMKKLIKRDYHCIHTEDYGYIQWYDSAESYARIVSDEEPDLAWLRGSRKVQTPDW